MLKEDFKEITDRAFEMDEKIENIVVDFEGEIINDEYAQAFENRFAAVNPRLVKAGLYLTLDSTQNIQTNDYNFTEMNWKLIGYEGNVILENIEQIYDQYYTVENVRNKEMYGKFEEDLKDLKYEFVGDKFYTEYYK